MSDFRAFSEAALQRTPNTIETMMRLALHARHQTLKAWAGHWLWLHCNVQTATHRAAA